MVDAPSDSSSQLSVGASSLPCGAPATVESISNMSSPIGGIGKRLADMDVDRVCQELPRMAPAEHKQLCCMRVLVRQRRIDDVSGMTTSSGRGERLFNVLMARKSAAAVSTRP